MSSLLRLQCLGYYIYLFFLLYPISDPVQKKGNKIYYKVNLRPEAYTVATLSVKSVVFRGFLVPNGCQSPPPKQIKMLSLPLPGQFSVYTPLRFVH